jgi:hypothetical protein
LGSNKECESQEQQPLHPLVDLPNKATVGDGWVAPTLKDTIETFHTARVIAPHAGVVKSALRLFDELVKCDEEGILKDVRKAIEGN